MSNAVQQTITANQTLRFKFVGNFFRLMNSTGLVGVTFYRNGAEVSRSGPVLAGYAETLEKGFDEIAVLDRSGADNAIEFLSRNGSKVSYDRGAMSAQITNAIASKIPVSQLADYTNSFKSSATLAANTAEQIIAPGANINGVILVRADCAAQTGAGPNSWGAGLLAKTAAPTAWNDGDMIGMSKPISGVMETLEIADPILIPAGKGVYFWNGAAAQTGANRSILYKIL